MKLLHIEARSDKVIVLPKVFIDSLPKTVALFTTVQFLDNVASIIKSIEDTGRRVVKIKPRHCVYECQILGCSIEKFNQEFDSFLYVGDGYFHPKALLLKNDKSVFIYNPFSEKHFEFDRSEMDALARKEKGAILKFHSSKEIGVLLTIKPGQFLIKEANALKAKFPEKNFYFLVSNIIDFNSLEDFPFVEVFVNTACPRIAFDDSIKLPKPVVFVEDLL